MLKAKHCEKAGFFFKSFREDRKYVWVEDSNNIVKKSSL